MPTIGWVAQCRLVLHDSVYYSTREVGRLFETGRYLHNWALTYALGLAASDWRVHGFTPSYRSQLAPLNDRGVYVTPAQPRLLEYWLSTWKLGADEYRHQEARPRVNRPNYGRSKELAPGSEFLFYVLAHDPVELPHWVRLGLWMGKAEILQEAVPWHLRKGSYLSTHPLNPLDLPELPRIYDVVSMPPVSLLLNAQFDGPYVEIGQNRDKVRLPVNMGYLIAPG